MPNRAIENILSITALSILADKKVNWTEVESFTTTAQKIPSIQKAEPNLSAIWLQGWYDRHKIGLLKQMQSKSFAAWFRGKLDGIKNTEDREAILKTMKAVALSDHEFHETEKNLINFTANHWNIELH